MSMRYSRANEDFETHFSQAAVGEIQRSAFTVTKQEITTFDAGQLVPIYCGEVLPNDEWNFDMPNAVIRQLTPQVPTMGEMFVDFYAFFVPNRVVNDSWKAVQGENYNGSWVANDVTLATLMTGVSPGPGATGVQFPVGSIADHYGIPTQEYIPISVLRQMHDLKFRGYVHIYNEYFRDQNYQPPIPISKLNVGQFFITDGQNAGGLGLLSTSVSLGQKSDGSVGAGAVSFALNGSSDNSSLFSFFPSSSGRLNIRSAPLTINKLHDYFTSVLPSPMKMNGQSVFVPASGRIQSVPVVTNSSLNASSLFPEGLRLGFSGGVPAAGTALGIGSDGRVMNTGTSATLSTSNLYPMNLHTLEGEVSGIGISVEDLRMSAAIQQYAETLARGGSRYRSIVKSFFGVEVDNPYDDIPSYIGHIRRNLDLYQTAQTSASQEGSTPQGNLAAFGYTSTGGHLFTQTFLEHGYVHVFACVRHRNVYTSYLSPDNFRLSALDFYNPTLATISEQPVYSRSINPFLQSQNIDDVFGYQEAWAEYRYELDTVSGQMRSMPDSMASQSLAVWNYSDLFDPSLVVATGNWMKSNSKEVLDRTLAVTTASGAPQFFGQFRFKIEKRRQMPVYSVPGLDII